MKRAYTAPSHYERCVADRKPLRDGSGARCMRRRWGDSLYCKQHQAMPSTHDGIRKLCGVK